MDIPIYLANRMSRHAFIAKHSTFLRHGIMTVARFIGRVARRGLAKGRLWRGRLRRRGLGRHFGFAQLALDVRSVLFRQYGAIRLTERTVLSQLSRDSAI